WKVAGDPATKFNYLDKAVPAVQNGIKKVTLTDKSAKARGLIAFVIQGDRGNYPIAPGEAPISVAIELNDLGNPPGSMPGIDQCGEVRFNLPPLAPTCTAAATKLTCK